MLQAVLTNEAPDDDEPIRDGKNLRDTWPLVCRRRYLVGTTCRKTVVTLNFGHHIERFQTVRQ